MSRQCALEWAVLTVAGVVYVNVALAFARTNADVGGLVLLFSFWMAFLVFFSEWSVRRLRGTPPRWGWRALLAVAVGAAAITSAPWFQLDKLVLLADNVGSLMFFEFVAIAVAIAVVQAAYGITLALLADVGLPGMRSVAPRWAVFCLAGACVPFTVWAVCISPPAIVIFVASFSVNAVGFHLMNRWLLEECE